MTETYKCHSVKYYDVDNNQEWWFWQITHNNLRIASGNVPHERLARQHINAVLQDMLGDAISSDPAVIVREERTPKLETGRYLLDVTPFQWTGAIRELRRHLASVAWSHRRTARDLKGCPTGDRYLSKYWHERRILRLLRLLQRQGANGPLVGLAEHIKH